MGDTKQHDIHMFAGVVGDVRQQRASEGIRVQLPLREELAQERVRLLGCARGDALGYAA